MANTLRRIQTDIRGFERDKPWGIEITPHEENIRYFDATIQGPPGSPFEGGIFKLEIFFTETYPFEPPKVRFLTKMYHPNVNKIGQICLDILKDSAWTAAMQIRTVLLSIQVLMQQWNLDDPLDETIAAHYKNDLVGAQKTAAEWTKKYAK
ncbi:MAG: putative Ubiquitin-conjugating enzyme E2 36 [Streblomastix strix]|uniref:E2 ubiquitin-conjugating enzyme n=1 Tax=Streblomastix strix TaxID=222440 RepID=A0A5J4W162_9EUKA|nr:MAG: putative Ubiquitin-conjugating enzyme E2 36 [Streblomastix strix]